MLRLLSIGALLSMGIIGSAQAQTYVVNYTAKLINQAAETSGSFTIEQKEKEIALTAFSGKFNGIDYSLPQVGVVPAFGLFQIGATTGGVAQIKSGTDDFYFYFNPGTSLKDGANAAYTSTTLRGFANVFLTFGNAATPVAAAVPEPASWAMMIGGFGVIGGGLRTRRRAVKFATA